MGGAAVEGRAEISGPPFDGARGSGGILLSDLSSLVDPHMILLDSPAPDRSIRAHDVSIYDPGEPVEAGTIVLAVGVEIDSAHARELLRAAAARGVAAVVFRTESPAVIFHDSDVSVLRAKPTLTWTQILTLLRALVCLKSDGDTNTGLIANSIDGLADVVAAMVGGSVVVYDRGHEVVGYALLGHQIDGVRRETICGQRTPEQWVTRFTEDNTAYRTFRSPKAVVRVDGYDDLRTRLRIAVESDGDILGELSVAEGNNPFGERAEEALKVAARLAAPVMKRYVRAADGDRRRQRHLLLSVLHDGVAAVKHAPELGLRLRDRWLLVGLRLDPSETVDERVQEVLNERAGRLLSMELTFGETSPAVIFDRQVFYGLMPVLNDRIRDLVCSRLKAALMQLAQIGMHGYAAVGVVSNDLRAVPAARADVDRLLKIGLQNSLNLSVLTIEDTWAERSMLNINDALGADVERDCPPLAILERHDSEHGSDFVPTLAAFLDEFGSVSATAERLDLHQNTVRHRLQRIVEISGIDFANPVQRLIVGCFLDHAMRAKRPL